MLSMRSFNLFGAMLHREIVGERILLSTLDLDARNLLARRLIIIFKQTGDSEERISLVGQIKDVAFAGSDVALDFYLKNRSTEVHIKRDWLLASILYHDLGDLAFHRQDVRLLQAFYEDTVCPDPDLLTVNPRRHLPDIARGFEALQLAAAANGERATTIAFNLASLYAIELDGHEGSFTPHVYSLNDHYRTFQFLHRLLEYTEKNQQALLAGTRDFAELGSLPAINQLIDWYTSGNHALGVVQNQAEVDKWIQARNGITEILKQRFHLYFERALDCIIRFDELERGDLRLQLFINKYLHITVGAAAYGGRAQFQAHDYFMKRLKEKAAAQDIYAMHYLASSANSGSFPYAAYLPEEAVVWYQKILDTCNIKCPMVSNAARAIYELHDAHDVSKRAALLRRAYHVGCAKSAVDLGAGELQRGCKQEALNYFQEALERSNHMFLTRAAIVVKLKEVDALSDAVLMPYYLDLTLRYMDDLASHVIAVIRRKLAEADDRLYASWVGMLNEMLGSGERGVFVDRTKEMLGELIAELGSVKRLKCDAGL